MPELPVVFLGAQATGYGSHRKGCGKDIGPGFPPRIYEL